ncbi:serine/threonine-protein kinase HipA [Silvibacterium bohemicum]|uniref:Serine/threonine-protein kinase HipA n=1 Tax=Silvibacterium bohemicum TaxID=1577686 RepID=A0A841JSN9_9BACT|nr:type II toxin-antitoxin system HipA family toxin [Silvibacterium bohemicum]MBB6144326.1 serine/threonine-protein kinase HipA [Silvibacterium bohemicum]
MAYSPTELLNVYLDARNQRHKVGRLAFRDRQVLFEYDPSFLASGIEISPIKLPLKAGVSVADTAIFDGLFGVFNDSLPDGWGRLLLDRTVEKHGVHRGQLNPLDRLAYVGRHGMGALSYEPELGQQTSDDSPLALDRLAEESAAVLAGENEEVFEELLRLNGSSSGARPKIVAQVSGDKRKIIHGRQELQPGFTHWMIKFPSSQDTRDVGATEYAYSLMARDAGVEMSETHLFRTRRNRYFGTKRFDRDGDARIHMHSLGGLIHADHRSPSLDYDTVLRVTLALTRNIQDAEKAYALACFNVLAHNRDDHVKNFSFLLNARNEWVFAPAYDLVFSYGPGGEQSMLVMGEGKNPGTTQLLALGKQYGIKNAPEILAKVGKAVADWPRYADLAEISRKSTKQIADKIKLH